MRATCRRASPALRLTLRSWGSSCSWFLRQVCKITTTPGLIILLVGGVWYLGYRICRMLVFAGSSSLVLRQVQQDCVKPLSRLVMVFAQGLNKLTHACVSLEDADSVLQCLAVRCVCHAVVGGAGDGSVVAAQLTRARSWRWYGAAQNCDSLLDDMKRVRRGLVAVKRVRGDGCARFATLHAGRSSLTAVRCVGCGGRRTASSRWQRTRC